MEPAQNHACLRAFERYGIVLDLEALQAVEARLAGGEGMILRRDPDGSVVTVVRIQEQLATVVFNPKQGRIITFYPADAPTKRARWRRLVDTTLVNW